MPSAVAFVAPVSLTLVLVIAALVLARRARARASAELRSWWGHVPPHQPGAAAAAALEALWPTPPPGASPSRIDDRTWHDLDLDAVFERLDRCTSPVGSQVLYLALRRTDPDVEAVATRRELADQLAADAALRERVQLCLRHLRGPRAVHVADMLWRPLPPGPRLAALAPLLAAAAVAVPLLAWRGAVSPVLLLAVFVANTAVHFAHRRRIDELPLGQLGSLVRAGKSAAALDEQGLAFDYRLRPGPTTTRNAIALLEHMGYPSALVAEARRLAEPNAPAPASANGQSP